MSRSILLAAVLALAAGAAQAQPAAPPPRAKAPWGALTDIVGAGEIVLRDVCLPGVLEAKPVGDLAYQQWLVSMPPKSAQAGPADKVWRLASLSAVYAVAWNDGSC